MFEYEVLHILLNFQDKTNRVLAEQINRNALHWLDQEKEKPFYLFIIYYDVHDPYIQPHPYRSMFSDKENPGGLINTDWDMDHHYLPLTPEQLQDEIDAYDGGIAYVDHYIGELLNHLNERGTLKNTAVIIAGDHGEMFGEHGLMGHAGSFYLPEIHVPLIIWQPAIIPDNVRINKPLSLTSISTTVMDLAGVDANNIFPRSSLQPLWEYPGDVSDLPAQLSEITQQWWVPKQDLTRDGGLNSIIAPQYQYIIHEKYGEELYNLVTDPIEGNNLINDADKTDVINQMRNELIDLTKAKNK